MTTLGSVLSYDTDDSGSSSEFSPTSSYETWCGEALGPDPGAHADWPPHRNDGSRTAVKLLHFAKGCTALYRRSRWSKGLLNILLLT